MNINYVIILLLLVVVALFSLDDTAPPDPKNYQYMCVTDFECEIEHRMCTREGRC